MTVRRIVGPLGSLGVGLMLAAAGLAFDAKTLTFAGFAIFALMAALWLFTWSRAEEVPVPELPLLPAEEGPTSGPLDSKEKALQSLRRARESAVLAKARKSNDAAGRAYHELRAALLSVKREFGIGMLKFTSETSGTMPYENLMNCYIAYVDRIYPLLREGHIDEALAEAKSFKWRW